MFLVIFSHAPLPQGRSRQTRSSQAWASNAPASTNVSSFSLPPTEWRPMSAPSRPPWG